LGIVPIKKAAISATAAYNTQLQQLDGVEPAEKRQALQLLDAFIERGRLKKKVGG
jgi:hypothetical protein